MIKIALTGKMRSGKDTVGYYAIDFYNMTRFSFGDALKKEFHERYPHIPEVPKPVKGYQLFGQLERYVTHEDVWVDATFDRMQKVRWMAENYDINGTHPPFAPIITDVRQQNEFDRLKEEGFTIIRVYCPDEVRRERIKSSNDDMRGDELDFHTETEMDSFDVDYTITNSGSIVDLQNQFDKVMTNLVGAEVMKKDDSAHG